jgi:hypothetical protein
LQMNRTTPVKNRFTVLKHSNGNLFSRRGKHPGVRQVNPLGARGVGDGSALVRDPERVADRWRRSRSESISRTSRPSRPFRLDLEDEGTRADGLQAGHLGALNAAGPNQNRNAVCNREAASVRALVPGSIHKGLRAVRVERAPGQVQLAAVKVGA